MYVVSLLVVCFNFFREFILGKKFDNVVVSFLLEFIWECVCFLKKCSKVVEFKNVFNYF